MKFSRYYPICFLLLFLTIILIAGCKQYMPIKSTNHDFDNQFQTESPDNLEISLKLKYLDLNLDATVFYLKTNTCSTYIVSLAEFKKDDVIKKTFGSHYDPSKLKQVYDENSLVSGTTGTGGYQYNGDLVVFTNSQGRYYYQSSIYSEYSNWMSDSDDYIKTDRSDILENHLSPEQAIEKARNFAQTVGLPINDTTKSTIASFEQKSMKHAYYLVRFSRLIDDIPVCPDDYDMTTAERSILGQSVDLEVSGDGVLQVNAVIYSIDEVKSENNNIVTVQEAIQKIQENSSNISLYYSPGAIDRIELNYCLYPIKDNLSQVEMRPAWVFYSENGPAVLRVDAITGNVDQLLP